MGDFPAASFKQSDIG